jgi:SNF2-related domain
MSNQQQQQQKQQVCYHQKYPLGLCLKKKFDGFGVFEGRIESFDSSTGYYNIKYSDGDIEEFDENDIDHLIRNPAQYMIDNTTTTTTTAASSTKKKSNMRLLNNGRPFPVGTVINKYFEGHGFFEGEVIRYNRSTGYYRVRYTDDEEEHLVEREIARLKIDKVRTSEILTGSSSNNNNEIDDDNEDEEEKKEEEQKKKKVTSRFHSSYRHRQIDGLAKGGDSVDIGVAGNKNRNVLSSSSHSRQIGSKSKDGKNRDQGKNKTVRRQNCDSGGGIPPGAEVIEIDSSSDDDEVEIIDPPPVACQRTASSAVDSSNGGEISNKRRSERERKSTVTYIDGHAVLKSNNYIVRGMAYHYEENGDSAPPTSKRKNSVESSSSFQKRPKTNRHRKRAPHEVRLQKHNENVRQAKVSKQPLKLAFFKVNKLVLKPFLEDAVYNRLCDVAMSSSVQTYTPNPVTQPSLITGGTMRDYQLEGLRFMVGHYHRNLGTILGDEMGLGKTLQSISLICHLKEKEGRSGPSLIVCPLSVLSSWVKELDYWAPSLKIFRLHSSGRDEQARQRKELIEHMLGSDEDPTPYDVVLTSYDMLKVKPFQSTWHRVHFNYLILDEGHKVKGHETDLAAAVRKVHSENQLILTGTPLQNNLVELWSLLNVMYKDLFTTLEPFKTAFDLNDNRIDKEMLVRAQGVLRLVMLRRLKNRVETLLPSKLETTVYW